VASRVGFFVTAPVRVDRKEPEHDDRQRDAQE
jgi:hypothetical protein